MICIVSSASGPAPSGFILVFGHVLEAGTLRAGTHLNTASDGRTGFVTPALHAAAFGHTRVTRKCRNFRLQPNNFSDTSVLSSSWRACGNRRLRTSKMERETQTKLGRNQLWDPKHGWCEERDIPGWPRNARPLARGWSVRSSRCGVQNNVRCTRLALFVGKRKGSNKLMIWNWDYRDYLQVNPKDFKVSKILK